MFNAAVLYAVTCIVFGVAAVAYTVYQRNKIRASETWQPVMGSITKAGVAERQSSDSTDYLLDVSYEYVVNGSRYTGTRIEFGQSRAYLRRKTAEAQLAVYPVHGAITVYFNPDKPEDSVLSRNAPYTVLYLIVGILSLILGLFIVWRGR